MSDEKITKDELYNVVEFSNALYNVGNLQEGLYTPFLLNQVMNNLNNNSRVPTYEKLVEALSNYKDSADNLRAYSEFMEKFDMLYERTVEYYANMLSFDLSITCKTPNVDYKSAEYKADKDRVYKFLDCFDYEAEFRKMTKQMLRNETVFTWLRRTTNRADAKRTLQIMPQDRCILTGYFEKGLLYDFDMNYFLQAGVDINAYDPIFKKYFNNTFDNSTIGKYIPTNTLNDRYGTYAMYTQTSPDEGAWAFKLDMSNFNSTPFLAPLLKSAILNSEMEKLQYDKNIISAYGILAGSMRMIDPKSGKEKNQFAVSPDVLGQFMALVAAGLNNSKFKAVAMPTEDNKFYQYTDSNPSMDNTWKKTSSGLGNSASRLIYNSEKMNNAELENAIMTDYNVVRKTYSQFSNFLDFYVNKITTKYKFNFTFNGSTYPFERAKRTEGILKLAEVGLVLNSSAFASAFGYKPNDFDRMLDEAKNGDLTEKLTPLISIHTSSGNQGGRPQEDSGSITESGQRKRDNK